MNIIYNKWEKEINDKFKDNENLRYINLRTICNIKDGYNNGKPTILICGKCRNHRGYLLEDEPNLNIQNLAKIKIDKNISDIHEYYKNKEQDKTWHKIDLKLPNNIKKIYSLNCNTIEKGKYNAIPLGILPKQKRVMEEFLNKENNFDKNILVYFNSAINSHPVRRYIGKYILPKIGNDVYFHNDINYGSKIKSNSGGVKKIPESLIIDFYTNICKSKFMFCTEGLQIDVFRIWEAVLLDCIPIVTNFNMFRHFENDIPLLLIDNYNDINRDFLEEKYDDISKRKYNKNILNIDYWVNKIKQDLETINE